MVLCFRLARYFTSHHLHLEDRSWQHPPFLSGIAPEQPGRLELLVEQALERQRIRAKDYRQVCERASWFEVSI
jgi:hypothetical protein